jgi:integrase
VDFDRKVIVVRYAKGNKNRVVMRPRSLLETLRHQLTHAHMLLGERPTKGASRLRGSESIGSEMPKVAQSWGWY